MKRQWYALVAASLWLAGCQVGGSGTVFLPCPTPDDCAVPGKVDGADGGATLPTFCDPANPANGTLDTDCDGLSDSEEYSSSYGGRKTDPCKADSDGDGLEDGVELGSTSSVDTACGFSGDADPSTRTVPTRTDSDGDGLEDGAEDKNHDGAVQPGESNPLRKDSDCDGISDSNEVRATFGCATDPLEQDSDGDGLPDGVEEGIVAPGADHAACAYPASTFDTAVASRSDACTPDSDGDGIMDGAEDTNHNGKVDPGELDPKNPADAVGPAQQACSTANLKPIRFHLGSSADVQVALVPQFAEVTKLLDPAGVERGLIFYDATSKVGGLVLSRPPVGANAAAEETDARSRLQGLGTLSAPITQTFATWDGFGQSVRGTYDQAGNVDLKVRLNDLARAFLGGNVTGTLPGTAGAAGPFKVQAEYVRRAATRSVLLFAIVPAASFTGKQVFRVDDVAGGSAVAQFGDFAGTQCEVFTSRGNANVDFLWVVDNSLSMNDYQAAIGNAASLFAQKLASAGLNWRAGGVSTGYYFDTSATEYRAFTSQIAVMQGWFTEGGPTWWGVSGKGVEESLQSARNYIPQLLPRTTNATLNKIRTTADLHLILLGDADDQSATPITTLNSYFLNFDGAGSRAVVHGIVCPLGATGCDTQRSPRRNFAAIAATGGVLGDINVAQSGSPQLANTLDAILSAAIAGTGHQLQRPPLSATIKVAIETGGTVGACNVADVPRDRVNGFDYDSASRKLVFFGACRPSGAGKKVAVSYRFWNDATPDPAGEPCGNRCADPYTCNAATGQCVCQTDCGGCASGLSCDLAACACTGIN